MLLINIKAWLRRQVRCLVLFPATQASHEICLYFVHLYIKVPLLMPCPG